MNTERHASLEQLLEIKDGTENLASQHVNACDYCQAELSVLQSIQSKLFEQADEAPAPHLWQRIEATIVGGINTSTTAPIELVVANQSNNVAQQRSLSHAVYTLAASIFVTGFIGLYMFTHNNSSRTQNELLQANIQQLMINSRGMEQALEKVALQSELLTATQRTQADRLYWQLAYLDQMIHESNVDTQTDPQRVEVLWNNRIQALRDLNQLYYQRQQTLSDSEI